MPDKEEQIQLEISKLKNLVSLKNRTPSQLREMAEDKVRNKDLNDLISGFHDKNDKRVAKELVKKYISDYTIESVSDRNTLQEVVRLEIIQSRLHKKMEEIYNSESKAVSGQYLETVHKNGEMIIKLKNSLGLNKGKDKKSSYDVLQHLIKRGEVWRRENQGSRTFKCPHCMEYILLKIRKEAWEEQKHPFFKDNRIYNKALFEKYYGKTMVIDAKFIAEVLETSTNYPEWMIEKRRGAPAYESIHSNEHKEVEEVIPSEAEEQLGDIQGSV